MARGGWQIVRRVIFAVPGVLREHHTPPARSPRSPHTMSPRTTIPLLAATALLSLPALASASADRNHDGLPDGWETRHHLSLKVNQSNRDADHDGLTNKGERRHGTDPRKADTDRDGMKDGDEVRTGNNPRRRDSDGDGTKDGAEHAGMIASFANGILTVKLTDGSTVKGHVDGSTTVSCHSSNEQEIENETTGNHNRRGATTARAAKNGGGGATTTDPAPATDPASTVAGSGRDPSKPHNETENENENEQGAENENESGDDSSNASAQHRRRGRGNCASSELKPGTAVHEAEMHMSSAGAMFDSVDVLR